MGGDDLAALACDPEVESRIVYTRRAGRSWVLEHGPFQEEQFSDLPDSEWTLLVQDVDKHIPAVRGLLDLFRFIPSWRIDDIMISFAADGGSVGPHWDDYDVFLIQAEGIREWKLDAGVGPEAPSLEGTDLRILSDFQPEQVFTAHPGDLLYLPPRVGHWGVADGPCITWSVGFRAPSGRSLLSGICERASASEADGRRYGDPGLEPAGDQPGLIRPGELARLRQLVRAAADQPDAQLDRWLAEIVSEVKPGLHPEPGDATPTLEDLLAGNSGLILSARARCFYILREGTIEVVLDGCSWSLPAAAAPLIDGLNSGPLSPASLASWYASADVATRELVGQWLADGWLEPWA